MTPSQSTGKGKRRWGAWLSLAVACAFTGALFWYLARTTTLDDWINLYRGLPWPYFFAYLVLFLTSMALKASRYKVLLGASGETSTPRYKDLVVVTFVSNLFVDLLPARTGGLAYVVFLNRKLSVGLPAAFSSFAFSFIFDLIGMLPLFCLAIILHQVSTGGGDPGLWFLLGLLAIIAVVALILLEKVLNIGATLVNWLAGRLGGKLHEWAGRLAAELGAIGQDVTRVKAQGVFWRVLFISVGIRVLKYVSLYILVSGLAAQWPEQAAKLSFPLVLFALVAAEATASLPISGIAGFGAYEGVMMATLMASGLAATQAALIPFGLHLLTQTVDYTLGGIALVILSLTAKPEQKMAPKKGKRRLVKWVGVLIVAGVIVMAGVHFGPRYFYRYFGHLVMAEVPTTIGQDEKDRIRQGTAGLKAKVVWTSSRSGKHEIYLLTLPGLEMYKLTKSDHVNNYPRFSPDGKQIVFARSQKKWVSARNEKPWDIYRLDLTSGKEHLVAQNGNYPGWVGNDQVSFMRGTQVVVKKLGGGERVALELAQKLPKSHAQTPEFSPNQKLLAFTSRGRTEATYVFNPAKKHLRKIGGGCQLTWFPDSKKVLWVENGGNGGNRILAMPLSANKPKVFMDLPGKHSHEYFPQLSSDGRWLVWAATASGHEHDMADYELFIWRTDQPWDKAVRLTYNKGNDRWPDIHLEKK